MNAPMNAMLRNYVVLVLALTCANARGAPLDLVSLPKTTVLAVSPQDPSPPAYAAAFGKLVGFYAQPNRTFQVVFPQMSLSLVGKSYAAIAISGVPQADPGVEVLELPACKFVRSSYVGNYPGLPPAVEAVIANALSEGFAINRGCGVRVLHLNSPDDTPADKLSHEIYVPVVKR